MIVSADISALSPQLNHSVTLILARLRAKVTNVIGIFAWASQAMSYHKGGTEVHGIPAPGMSHGATVAQRHFARFCSQEQSFSFDPVARTKMRKSAGVEITKSNQIQ